MIKQDPLPEGIDHVVVLMMENRSFDHMLGYLPHPKPDFEGLRKPLYAPGTEPLPTTMDARYAIYPGPDHSFEGTMLQLFGVPPGKPVSVENPTNNGFEASFEAKIVKATKEKYGNRFINKGYGRKVMRCFHPEMVPVLSTLALEYAVCDNWFCSAPMGTFPNRDFLHAGTAFERDHNSVKPRPHDKTIFRRIEAAGKEDAKGNKASWRLYHRNVAHLWLYPQLFGGPGNHSSSHDRLITDIRTGDLPSYAFVEPDYGDVATIGGEGESQHPSQADSLGEFVRGEALIARIYNAFIDELARPDSKRVFERSVFVITYDEHGGFYDHVPPPPHTSQPDLDILDKEGFRFEYNLYGPRVPAVVISPMIERHTVDHTEYDHTSIYQTIRKTFCTMNAMPGTDRDGTANTFSHLLTRSSVRTLGAHDENDRLRRVTPLTESEAVAKQEALAAPHDEADDLPIYDMEFARAMSLISRP